MTLGALARSSSSRSSQQQFQTTMLLFIAALCKVTCHSSQQQPQSIETQIDDNDPGSSVEKKLTQDVAARAAFVLSMLMMVRNLSVLTQIEAHNLSIQMTIILTALWRCTVALVVLRSSSSRGR